MQQPRRGMLCGARDGYCVPHVDLSPPQHCYQLHGPLWFGREHPPTEDPRRIDRDSELAVLRAAHAGLPTPITQERTSELSMHAIDTRFYYEVYNAACNQREARGCQQGLSLPTACKHHKQALRTCGRELVSFQQPVPCGLCSSSCRLFAAISPRYFVCTIALCSGMTCAAPAALHRRERLQKIKIKL